MSPLPLALLLALLRGQDSSDLGDLQRRLEHEHPIVRGAAADGILERWKQWSEAELARLDTTTEGHRLADRVRARRLLGRDTAERLAGSEETLIRGGMEARLALLERAAQLCRERTLAEEDLEALAELAHREAWSTNTVDFVTWVGGARIRAYADLIAPHLNDSDGGVRARTAWSLGMLGALRHSYALRAMLKDSDPLARGHAAWALAVLGFRDAGPAISELLTDRDWQVRWNAARSLARLGMTDRIPNVLELLEDPSPLTRSAAIHALGELQARAHWERMRFFLGSATALTRVDAIHCLARMGAVEAVPDLLETARRPEPELAVPAILAVGELESRLHGAQRENTVKELESIRGPGAEAAEFAADVVLIRFGRRDAATQRRVLGDLLERKETDPDDPLGRAMAAAMARAHESAAVERLNRPVRLEKPVATIGDLCALLKGTGLTLQSGDVDLECRLAAGIRITPARALELVLGRFVAVPEGDALTLRPVGEALSSWRQRLNR